MQWFRLYDDVLDDPKVQQLKPDLFKHWINLLCLANKNDPRGYLPPEWKDIAFRLRVSPKRAVEIVRELVALELIDEGAVTFRPHNWDERQRKSDNVAERVAKHRSNVTGNVTETPPVTPPDTDTESDTDSEQKQTPTATPSENGDRPKSQKTKADGYPEAFETQFWEHYPKGRGSKADALRLWSKLSGEERAAIVAAFPAFKASRDWREGFQPAPEVWLKGRRWENPPPMPPPEPDPYEAWKNGNAAVAPELLGRRAS